MKLLVKIDISVIIAHGIFHHLCQPEAAAEMATSQRAKDRVDKFVCKHKKSMETVSSKIHTYIYIYNMHFGPDKPGLFVFSSRNWLYPLKPTGNFIFPVFDVSFKVTNWLRLVNRRICVHPTPKNISCETPWNFGKTAWCSTNPKPIAMLFSTLTLLQPFVCSFFTLPNTFAPFH